MKYIGISYLGTVVYIVRNLVNLCSPKLVDMYGEMHLSFFLT